MKKNHRKFSYLFRFRFALVALIGLLSTSNFLIEAQETDFRGSASFWVSNRFFDSKQMRNSGSDESPWGVLQFNAQFGVWDFPYGIEPVIGIGVISNVRKGKTASFTDHRGAAANAFHFMLLIPSVGVRWKAWDPDFFIVSPYVELLFNWTYSRTYFAMNGKRAKLMYGSEFGFQAGGGLMTSFFFDRATRDEMRSTWELKDFGLLTSLRYLKGGLIKSKGLAYSSSTSWDFGLGLYLDW